MHVQISPSKQQRIEKDKKDKKDKKAFRKI